MRKKTAKLKGGLASWTALERAESSAGPLLKNKAVLKTGERPKTESGKWGGTGHPSLSESQRRGRPQTAALSPRAAPSQLLTEDAPMNPSVPRSCASSHQCAAKEEVRLVFVRSVPLLTKMKGGGGSSRSSNNRSHRRQS